MWFFNFDSSEGKFFVANPKLSVTNILSSFVFDALENLKLFSEDIIALYTEQNIYSYERSDFDLRKGIEFKLYIPEIERFGILSKKNEKPVDMWILANDDKGRIVYAACTSLLFQRARLVDFLMSKSLQSKSA